MSFTENMALFFGDLAVSATIVAGTSTSSVSCYFDTPSQSMLAGAGLSDETSILMSASDVPTLARGDSLTIGTNSYAVRQVELQDDGALKRVMLVTA